MIVPVFFWLLLEICDNYFTFFFFVAYQSSTGYNCVSFSYKTQTSSEKQSVYN